jgi:hypothetical protein
MQNGTFTERHALLSIVTSFVANNEGAMATKPDVPVVETAREARGAEPGPSVLALLTISLGLAIIILGVVWFVFFRT